jgi:hypothetical protein
MPSSLSDPGVRGVLAAAKAGAGTPGGPWPSPGDWRDQSIYFLLVDRFARRDGPPAHQPWNDPHHNGYQGGTFAGIRDQAAPTPPGVVRVVATASITEPNGDTGSGPCHVCPVSLEPMEVQILGR